MRDAGATASTPIAGAFARARAERRTAFIPYVTAGDPDLATTLVIVEALKRGGADLVEIGVPFSDPIADGPVIQRAAERALRNGVSLENVLDLAGRLHGAGAPPIVLFTYYNPIHRMGLETFAARAAKAGVQGVLTTDLPHEEGSDLRGCLEPAGIDMIYLLAPTTSPERMKRIACEGRGFLYVISRTGVTGVRDDIPADLPGQLRAVRAVAGGLPVAVGFGISRPEQFRAIASNADGVVVGSAIVRLVEECGPSRDLPGQIESLCHQLTGR